MLDYGCGRGAVTCAIAERAGRVIGYDIDPAAVAEVRDRAAKRDLANVEAHCASAAEIFDRVREHAGVDVVLLYAVIEHLTLAERLEALRVAQEIVHGDGAIVVIETPNRLVYTDYHTSQLPFFSQLPPELALSYADRSPRPEFREAIAEARAEDADGGATRLARWGSGVSFHEFELVFGDMSERVIAGGYDPALLGERTIHTDELALARYIERARPDVPPPFSRYWLDLVISPRPLDPATVRLVRPWAAETVASRHAKLTSWDTIAVRRRRPLAVRAPAPVDRVVCVLTAGVATTELRLRAPGEQVRVPLSGTPAYPLVADVRLAQPAAEFTLEPTDPAHIQFVGYELSADRASAASPGE